MAAEVRPIFNSKIELVTLRIDLILPNHQLEHAEGMNFHTLIARNGGRRREIGAGEVSGENHHFPAAGAAADLGGGLGRDAEAEPVLLAPVPTAAAAGGLRYEERERES